MILSERIANAIHGKESCQYGHIQANKKNIETLSVAKTEIEELIKTSHEQNAKIKKSSKN